LNTEISFSIKVLEKLETEVTNPFNVNGVDYSYIYETVDLKMTEGGPLLSI